MEITLEKIELVKDRTGVTYAEAKQALEETDGSVVDAIIAIEEIINSGEKGKGFGKKGEALFSRLKEIVKKGNVSKIQVKKDGELVLNVPVNAGLVGVVIAPIVSGGCSSGIWLQMLHRDHQNRWNYHRCERCCDRRYGNCSGKEQRGWRDEGTRHDLVSERSGKGK